MKRPLSMLLSLLFFFFSPFTAAPADQFADVASDAWYYEAVNYAVENGIFSGMSETAFEPDASITRAQFVAVLARKSQVDISEYKGRSRFSDVNLSLWYAPYVEWAALYDLASGIEQRKFSPDTAVTREQMAVFLYRYAELTGNDTSYTVRGFYQFSDYSKVSAYAVTAMQWAVSHGIIIGSDGRLNPKGNATRAQAAAIMKASQQVLVNTEIVGDPSYITAQVKGSAGLYARIGDPTAPAVLSDGMQVRIEQTGNPLWYQMVPSDAMRKRLGLISRPYYLYAESLYRVESGKAAATSLYQEFASERFAQLQLMYPHGKYWNHMGQQVSTGTATPYSVTNTPCNHSRYGENSCNRYTGVMAGAFGHSTCMQCMGFASLLSDEVFGASAPIHSYRDLKLLRVGDHIRYRSTVHSVTVTGIYDSYITVAEVNRDFTTCKIEWGRQVTYTELANKAWEITCYTRYPLSYTGSDYTAW